jgi:hypothetical protein
MNSAASPHAVTSNVLPKAPAAQNAPQQTAPAAGAKSRLNIVSKDSPSEEEGAIRS